MRFSILGVLALCAPLVACGEPPGGEMGNDVALDGDIRIEPGLYQMQIFLDMPEGQGGGSQYADDSACFTPEQVEGGYREMLLDMQGRDSCDFASYELDGDQLKATMVCKGDSLQPQTEATITGTVTPTATDLRMAVDGVGNGQGNVGMRVVSERIGECEGDAK